MSSVEMEASSGIVVNKKAFDFECHHLTDTTIVNTTIPQLFQVYKTPENPAQQLPVLFLHCT